MTNYNLSMSIEDCKNQLALSYIKENNKSGSSLIHPNQEKTSIEILKKKLHNKIAILVWARVQSGKTGTMVAIIKNVIMQNLYNISNISIITGLNDKEWKNQMKDRLPSNMTDQIFHRSEIFKKGSNFFSFLENKRDQLILIDEGHIAATQKQTIRKVFEKLKFYEPDYMKENNIKIIEFTATPKDIIYDIKDLKNDGFLFKQEPGPGYRGMKELFKEGRVKQFQNLCGYGIKNGKWSLIDKKYKDHLNELKKTIETFDSNRYHFIRISTNNKQSEQIISNFKGVFGSKYNYNHYNSSSSSDYKSEDININICNKPDKHTFIFLKNLLTCAKTIIKTYLGVWYERKSKTIQEHVIIQGARDSGYDNNGTSITYTDINTIFEHEKNIEKDFGDIPTNYKGTYNSSLNGSNFSSTVEESHNIIYSFPTFKEVQQFYNDEYKTGKEKGPNKIPDQNKDGFYFSNIRKDKKIRSLNDVETNCNWGINKKNKYRVHACYGDIYNIETLEWYLVIYERHI